MRRWSLVVLALVLLGVPMQAQIVRLRFVLPISMPGAATLPTDANQIFLSDRGWSISSNGWGPTEKDLSLGDLALGDGVTQSLAGLTYAKGLGVHAPSVLTYALNKRCTSFRATIGVDDEVGVNGSVVFQVLTNGDATTKGGTVAYTSPTMTGSSASIDVVVDVTNQFELALRVTDAGDGIAYDHADWAFARVICTTPTGTTNIPAGTSIQTALTAGAVGDKFILQTGVHRLTSAVTPKASQEIEGEFGTILSGAAPLTSWTQTSTGCSPQCWYASGQTQGSRNGLDSNVCWTNQSSMVVYPCLDNQDTFFDNVPLVSVSSLAELTDGRFYFDYAADRLYIYADPSGHTVETILADNSVAGSVANVRIRNLTIEKFGQQSVNLAAGWILEDTEARHGHYRGVWNNDSSITRRCYIHHNGAEGLGGSGSNVLIEDNENSYNNYNFYNPFWGGGGSKWVFTGSLTVQRNFSHHNFGPGFWTDISNINVSYLNNIVADNDRAGIFHEISYDALISGNTISRNGVFENSFATGYGGGIQIINSRNVEVTGNTLVANANGIKAFIDAARLGAGDPNATFGAWEVTGLNVHGNTNCTLGAEEAGLNAAAASAYYDAPANNHFTANTYKGAVSGSYFVWQGIGVSFATWQGTYSHDTTGSRTTTATCP